LQEENIFARYLPKNLLLGLGRQPWLENVLAAMVSGVNFSFSDLFFHEIWNLHIAFGL
jgi:hypothetical protein